MPMQSPPLLGPEYDDIGDRTEKLAIACTKTGQLNGWTPPADGSMDMARALIRVFEKMARHAANRINRIPERNFLAFLDRIGVTPSASRAARVPLTFTLVAGSDAEPTVPGRTRVGAMPLPGDSREVIFETERDLFTTRANLASVFVRQPNGDRLADCTGYATGAIVGAFDVFDAGDPATHALYLAADDVFGLPAGTSVTCAFVVDTATKWTTLHATTVPTLTGDTYYPTHQPAAPLVRWTYWNGRTWSPLTVTVPTGTTNLVFVIPNDMASTTVRGRQARWIRGQLLAWPAAGVPTINSVTVSASPAQTGKTPTAVYSNGRPVDLSIDFYPFGETPRLNDMLLVACDGLLDRRGANVSLQITLNTATKNLKTTDVPVLTWEVSTGSGWRVVAANVMPTNTVVTTMYRNDVLRTATFTVPADAAATTIGITNSVWLRIRLSGGSFGTGLSIDYAPTTPKTTDDGFRPPLIQSLLFSSTPTITNTKPVCVTEDDFAFEDRSASFPMFSRSADDVQTLYLGFDQKFSARETRLYFAITPLDPIAAARETSASLSGSVVWEYATADGWKPLICEDETRSFAMSGFVGFVAPEDLGRRSLFSKDSYWFRARLRLPAALIASPPASPRVGRILTNTVWALDATTRTNEVLGSADGNAEASFPFTAQPILEGQTIEVREPNAPRDVPKNDISDDVDPRFTDQVWIRWYEVETFYASGPKDRHYTIDREAGVLHFGDGRRGMVPPRGAQNVRASMPQVEERLAIAQCAASNNSKPPSRTLTA